jgi:hypothetical protein
MSVAGRRIWGDGNLARYGNKKSPASTSSCDGALGRLEVGDWRVHSGSLCPSQQWPSARERASGRVWAGRNGRIGSFPDRPGSRSSSLPVSQKQCADASLFLFPHVAADSVATCFPLLYSIAFASSERLTVSSLHCSALSTQHSALSIEGSRQITCDLLPQ